MIQHVVMWKFADFAEGKSREENCAYIKERLLALPALIPEIKFMQLGRDVSGTDMSYDMMLVTKFDSLEDLHTYKVHPDHVAVSQYVKKVRVARVVLDAKLDENGNLV